MFPVEGRVSVATMPLQSGATPEQSSERSRTSNCVGPGATDATMSHRVSHCSGSASELSRSVSDAPMLDPEQSAPVDGPSATKVLQLSQSQIEAHSEWELFSPSFTMTSEPTPWTCVQRLVQQGGPSLRVEDLAQASCWTSPRCSRLSSLTS